MTDRITDKRLKNKRFRKTEEAIIGAFFLVKDKMSLERLIRIAGISRSTLYRHHKNITEIIPDYEKYILKKCKSTIQKFMKVKSIHLRTLYQRILIFMAANQPIMNFLLRYGDNDLAEKIVITISPKIIATGKINAGEMLNIYTKEVAAVIGEWGRAGFDKTKIITTLDKIMFLTNTAQTRLGPLAQFDHPTELPQSKPK